MEYDGNVVGPRLRELRKNKKMTLDEVSELTGLSISTLSQLEQGGRRMSLSSLYAFMNAFQCDANTLLNISVSKTDNELEIQLDRLSSYKKEKCKEAIVQLLGVLLENGGQSSA